jgi:endoglucanase
MVRSPLTKRHMAIMLAVGVGLGAGTSVPDQASANLVASAAAATAVSNSVPTNMDLYSNLYGAPVSAAKYLAQYPQLKVIVDVPQASWIVPSQTTSPGAAVSALATQAAGRTVQLVVYGIPDRDNGGYSSGGAPSEQAYYAWVGSLAWGIGNSRAIVVLEPDALGLSVKLAPTAQAARWRMLTAAVSILKKQPNAKVYVDASMWINVQQQSTLLEHAGIDQADGFAVNTSGFAYAATTYAYGDAVSALVGGKHYVIDTSRDGQGPLQTQWCNPPGRGLGALPEVPAEHPGVDGLLWIKHPGESDGPCNGGPRAGAFWPGYALGLIARANYTG